MKEDNRKVLILSIIGVLVLISLVVGATYAYFTFASDNQFGSQTIEANVEGIGSGVTLTKVGDGLTLDVSAMQMLEENVGISYYASGSEESATIGKIQVAGDGKFNCTYTMQITKTASSEEKDLYNKFQNMSNKSEGQIYLNVNEEVYDFNTADLFPITYTETLRNITSEEYIKANLTIVNANIDQTVLNGADIAINFEVTEFDCTYVDDETAPETFNIVLGGIESPEYTNKEEIEVYLEWEESDVESYCLTEENASTNCEWTDVIQTRALTYNTTTTFTLSSEEGLKTVYLYLRDSAYNISNYASDTITLDKTVPSNNSVSINNNATYTTSTNVTLTLLSEDASEMCISNTENCTDWEIYATSKSHTLTSTLGTKTVYVWFRDDAGNTTEVITDTISLYGEISTIPSQSGTLTYTGSSQSPSWNNYDSSKLTIGGTTSGTNAGSYNVTFTPKTNYIWSDGTTTAKTVSWSIGKASGSLSLSSTALSLEPGTSGTVTATRSGNGTVSATSNNTSVATVSVSGTTITVKGVAAGNTTIIVNVAAGTNYAASSAKTINVTIIDPSAGANIKNLAPSGYNSTMEGGLNRFQGTSTNNYICFGTSNKSTCTGNTDAYMYRIIGITSDNRIKVIKKEALNSTMQWHSSSTTNTTWPQSTIYNNINGSSFLNNTTYVPSGWSDKIATTTWKYGDFDTSDMTAVNLYSKENAWTNTTSAKIGLMYAHDYAYAYQSGGLNCSSSGSYSTCKTSWIYLWQSGNDTAAPSENYEWTMSRQGYSTSSYRAWYIHSYGHIISDLRSTLNSTMSVRPVFYLTSDVEFVGGSGTLADPFLIK